MTATARLPVHKRMDAYPREWSERAVLLARRGYTAREIQEHLRDEGKEVPFARIETWIEGLRNYLASGSERAAAGLRDPHSQPAELLRLALTLADASAAESISCNCDYSGVQAQGLWYDTRTTDALHAEEVRTAVSYLSQRGLLARQPGKPHAVSLRTVRE